MENTMKWLRLLHSPSDIVEIRSIDPRPVISGYFRADSPNIEKELVRYKGRTFYQTMNPLKQACYSRTQHETLIPGAKETSSENDFSGYQWILVDADPVRPSGVSATRDEKESARKVASGVKNRLHSLGFKDPIIADSGNGYHLLYKIHASSQDKVVIADFLQVLDMWFSTEEARIDTAVFNLARITKLYGATTHKGANTPDRPHRISQILEVPDPIEENSFDLIRHVASEVKKSVSANENPRAQANRGFDLEQFLASHQMEVEKRINISTGTKYLLKECPFDSNHRNGDAAVFAYSNGSYGFHCFHSSCSGYHWHEFREKLDPQTYAASTHTYHQSASAAEKIIISRTSRMLAFSEIQDLDRSKIQVVRSRLTTLDSKIGGFNKGELSIWSGSNGSGKSTLVGQLGLSAVTEGYKVALFSGEMEPQRAKEWLMLQAAGPKNVSPEKINPVHYQVNPYAKRKINEWIGDRISIYDNDFGTDWELVVNTIFNWVQEKQADVIIIDNLMALDLPVGTTDKYDMQSKIVKRFSAIAKQLNVHVHFICHPKKTEAFLRKGDISGTADLTNAADNVFMVHRANADFMTRYKSVYPKLDIPAGVTNVVEIMKNRDLGIVDELIMLYFDKTCKLMTDVKGLCPQFAWVEKLEQLSMANAIPLSPTEIPDSFPEEWRK